MIACKQMLRAYKYRIYPTEEQKILFAKTFGCCRFVYNWALETKKKLWEEKKDSIGVVDLTNKLKAELKAEKDWLKEVNSQSLQTAIRNCDRAFVNFFHNTGKYPNFKNKFTKQSFQNVQHCSVDFKEGTISIPKAKNVKCVFHRKFKGTIKTVTISKNPDNRYFVSILVDTGIKESELKIPDENTAIGIDTGIKTFAVCSNGQSFESPHFSEKEAGRLKHYQRQLKRKTKGSSSYNEVKLHIAKIHAKTANRRNDYLDKVAHRLTHENQVSVICVENLNIKGMKKNHHLAYSISDAGIGEFYRKLQYKCRENGINYVEIDRFAPSSKMCNVCGSIKPGLKLSEREWTCSVCQTHHDRDYNASMNIKNIGLRTLLAERKEVKPVDCPLVDDKKVRTFPKKQWQSETGKKTDFNSLEATKSSV